MSLNIHSVRTQGDGDSLQKEAEARRRQMVRKKHVARNQRGIIGTPPAVRGRKHENVQTEKYLEEVGSIANPSYISQ